MLRSFRAPKRLIWVGLALMLQAIVWPALAHAGLLSGAPSLSQYLNATSSTDLSTNVLTAAIGQFFMQPFAQVAQPAGSTLLSSVFVIFNAAVFAVGAAFATYGIGSGIVQSAHEGQVLGRRMSTVWFPIRMGVGIGGLVPIFGGYNMAQATMMFMCTVGIGIANFMYQGVVSGANNLQSLTSPAFVSSAVGGQTFKQTAYQLFINQVCLDAYKDVLTQEANAGIAIPASSQVVAAAPQAATDAAGNAITLIPFGTNGDYKLCGTVSVQNTDSSGAAGRAASGTLTGSLGFRVASVNYDQITKVAENAYTGASFGTFAQNVQTLADNWYTEVRAREAGDAAGSTAGPGVAAGSLPPFPLSDLNNQAQAYADSVGSAIQADGTASSQAQAITTGALSSMANGGWFLLGDWYSTFAEVQASINQAVAQVKLVGTPPSQQALAMSSIGDKIEQMQKAVNGAIASGGAESSSFDSPTGNTSFGQAIVSRMIKIAAAGSSGSGSGLSNLTMAGYGATAGSFPIVNPIIMSKNIGDYMMVTAEVGPIAMEALKAGNLFGLGGVAGKAVSAASGLLGGGLISKIAGGAIQGAVGFVTGGAITLGELMIALFLVGALFSLYIPMIPFIHWWGGIVQYVISVFEGLAASPLWAFAHLDAEGEGMGQRTQQGYLFLLNVTFRPALMVIGFVLASAIVTPLGSVLVFMFVQAMASAQGNSITGLASILGYLIIFFVLTVTLVGTVFNAITVLPDQIIGWVGRVPGMALGKAIESRVNTLFLAAIRFRPEKPRRKSRSAGRLRTGSNPPDSNP